MACHLTPGKKAKGLLNFFAQYSKYRRPRQYCTRCDATKDAILLMHGSQKNYSLFTIDRSPHQYIRHYRVVSLPISSTNFLSFSYMAIAFAQKCTFRFSTLMGLPWEYLRYWCD